MTSSHEHRRAGRAAVKRNPLHVSLAEPIRALGSGIEHESNGSQLRQAARVLARLARIARLSAHAREHRLAGRIQAAAIAEERLEACYAALPAEVRW